MKKKAWCWWTGFTRPPTPFFPINMVIGKGHLCFENGGIGNRANGDALR
jgi:hypothetical protein